MSDAPSANGAKDFDFLLGGWRVQHRRLKRRLQACDDWETFRGTSQAWPLLNGQGNVDDNLLELPGGHYRAVSLRAFDPASGSWSIWWLDARHPAQIDVPVRGRFVDGIGTFVADDQFEGRPIRVRFIWSRITKVGAQWEQAFSDDGGTSWETNWVMQFERA
jgi:hypothetical protein